MNEEYILDNEGSTPEMSEKEKEIMREIENLSKKCMEQNIPCFLTVKFSSHQDPTAAWHFGRTEQEGIHNFAKDIAPLFLFMTSQVTGTKVVVTNPSNGSVVYEVSPKQSDSENNG